MYGKVVFVGRGNRTSDKVHGQRVQATISQNMDRRGCPRDYWGGPTRSCNHIHYHTPYARYCPRVYVVKLYIVPTIIQVLFQPVRTNTLNHLWKTFSIQKFVLKPHSKSKCQKMLVLSWKIKSIRVGIGIKNMLLPEQSLRLQCIWKP